MLHATYSSVPKLKNCTTLHLKQSDYLLKPKIVCVCLLHLCFLIVYLKTCPWTDELNSEYDPSKQYPSKLIFVNVIARQIHNDSLAYLLCALTPRQGRALAVEQQINEFGRLNIHHVFVHDACQLSATLVSLNLISNSTRGLMFAPLLVCVWCPIAVCSQRVLCHFELEAFLSC